MHPHIGVGTTNSALDEDGVLDIDTTISLETTWHAMEDLVSMGLVRSIGIRCTDCIISVVACFVRYLGNLYNANEDNNSCSCGCSKNFFNWLSSHHIVLTNYVLLTESQLSTK